VTIGGSPATVSVGQQLSLSMTVMNTGGATARVTSATPSTGGTAAAACGSATGASQNIPGGAVSSPITWSCTVTQAGTLTLGASVAGTDLNNGGPLSTSASTTVIAQNAANLSGATLAASPSTVDTGQTFTLTFTVKNSGGAQANGVTPAAIAGATCTVLPTSANVAAGATQPFIYTCTSSTAGTPTLTASASGTDANNPADVVAATASTPITIQTPAALGGTLTGPASSTGPGSFSVTMQVTNSGQASANNVQPSALSVTLPPSVTLTSSPPATGVAIAGNGGTATFTWTYDNAGGTTASLVFSGSASGTDGTSGLPVSTPTLTSDSVSVNGVPRGGSKSSSSDGTGEVVLVAADALGDGTSSASLVGYQGAVLVGPSADGSRLARFDPSGASAPSVTTLAFGVDQEATPAVNAAWRGAALAGTLGAVGCAANSTACGPDGEAGATLVLGGVLGGVEELLLGGAGPFGARYLYAASGAGPLDFAWLDVRAAFPAGGSVLSAGLFVPGSPDRLYLGYSVAGQGPVLLALPAVPRAGGLDASPGTDFVDLGAAAMPGAAGASIVSAIADVQGVLYVAHDGGLVRAAAADPASAVSAPGDWALATPDAAAWGAKLPVAVASPSAPRDRTVPAVAAFGKCTQGPCVFAIRNVLGSSTQPTVVPQLWRCDPSVGPAQCAPGDWALAAANAAGDSLLSQLGDETNGAATVLVATQHWLYLGYDNGSSGVQLYRAALAPAAVSDFVGTNGCVAGSAGCQGIGGSGFGDRVTRVFDARAVTVGGNSELWIAVGDGTGPVRVYRIPD